MLYVSGNVETRKVKVNGKLLDPKHSQAIINHSPDGFSWGYEGSGPAQLALALLLLRTDEHNAARLHQDFKRDFVAAWNKDKNFSHKVPIDRWLKQHEAKVIHNDTDLVDYLPEEGEMVGRACGTFCTTAKSKDCNCSCGSKNHGKDLQPQVNASPFGNRTKQVQSEASEPVSEPYEEAA